MRIRHESAHYWACSDSQELEFTTDEGFDCVVESFWY